MDILTMLAAIEAGDVLAFARSIKGECDQFAEVTVADRTVIVARIGKVGIVAADPDVIATHEHDGLDSAIRCHDDKVAALRETAALAGQLRGLMSRVQAMPADADALVGLTIPDDLSGM